MKRAEVRTAFDQFRQMLGEPARAMRNAKELRPRTAPVEPLVPGTIAHLNASMEWARTLPNVKDLRMEARREVDRVWSGLAEECTSRFGRAPSTDPSNQGDPGSVIALGKARDAEAKYLALAANPHAGPESFKAAFNGFVASVAKWVNRATEGWPSAKARAAQARREEWR